jgi:hypothetical protein
MRLLLTLILLFLVLGATGCSDNPEWVSRPATPTTPTIPTITYNGTKGFVINGSGYSNTVVICDSLIGSAQQIFGSELFISVKFFGYLNNEPIVLELVAVADSAAPSGTYTWMGVSGTGNADVNLEINNNRNRGFTAVSGTTSITKFGGIGETIEGTFRGTMKSKDRATMTVEVYGKFSVIRRS